MSTLGRAIKYNSSVIRQKGESQNACLKKQSTPNFPINKHFLPLDTHITYIYIRIFFTPWYVCVSGGKKCLFFGKCGVLCFLETPVLRSAFLPYYRRINSLRSLGKANAIFWFFFIAVSNIWKVKYPVHGLRGECDIFRTE